MIDYTTVCGVDAKHLRQLAAVWPTWRRFKPSLLDHPMIVFRDRDQVADIEVRRIVDHPNLSVYAWPMGDAEYSGGEDGGDKWERRQRHMMLAGFVYVPAMFVKTKWWLKLDTDTIAIGMDDWIDPDWFEGYPVIVSHPWSFTKPPDQMVKLDEWVDENRSELQGLEHKPPLRLIPKEGWSRLNHKRIISWAAFFQSDFIRLCAHYANKACGKFQIPVPSQDGFTWYVATRLGLPIVRSGMKKRGWKHRTSEKGIREAVSEAMADGQQTVEA